MRKGSEYIDAGVTAKSNVDIVYQTRILDESTSRLEKRAAAEDLC